MTKHPNETAEMLAILRERVAYDPATGLLTWRPCGVELFKNRLGWRIWHGKFAGKPVGKLTRGYVIIVLSVNGKERYFQGHRVAWALMTGSWPEHEIDHRDTNPSNNCWSNLRPATTLQNAWNKNRGARNRSGFKGVHQHTQNGNWVAQIAVNGKRKHIGVFPTPEEAAIARQRVADALHGEFVRH